MPRKSCLWQKNEFRVYVKCNFEINHEAFKYEKCELLLMDKITISFKKK